MSAADTIQNLVTLGLQVSAAATKSGQTVSAFLTSSAFTQMQGSVTTLLNSLKPSDLQDADDAIQKKEADLLAGRDISALSGTELEQFHALVTMERQVVAKLIAQPNSTSFLAFLANELLPILLQVAKTVIPLL